jgi:hypothetical protein
MAMQCQQILNMLSTQAQQSSPTTDNNPPHQAATFVIVTHPSASHSPSNMAGIPMCLSIFCKPNLDYSVFSNKLMVKPVTNVNEWVINTGATDHMVTTTKFFTTMQVAYNVSVNLPNGRSVMVTHIGSISVTASLVLIDVLCVPSFDFNLISVSKTHFYCQLLYFLFVQTLFYSRLSTVEDDWYG